jgi:hypothetical protein
MTAQSSAKPSPVPAPATVAQPVKRLKSQA